MFAVKSTNERRVLFDHGRYLGYIYPKGDMWYAMTEDGRASVSQSFDAAVEGLQQIVRGQS